MVKCIKCGTELPEDSMFCVNCGTKQTVSQQSTPVVNQPQQNFSVTNHEIEILTILVRLEKGQQQSVKWLKSICSSTAILAAALIIQIIIAIAK